MGWAGFNCSLPHKVAVIEPPRRPGPLGRGDRCGQHRRRHRRRLVGHNTDGQGFVESLRTVVDPAGLDLVVLGAGGAARAVAVETALAGAASVTIVNRDAGRGEELARVVTDGHRGARDVRRRGTTRSPCPRAPTSSSTPPRSASATATPSSTSSLDTLRAGLVVADVVVSPPRTALLRAAEVRGARTLDGLGMLVGQGALAVRHWTGVEPDREVMRAAAARALGLE